MWQRPVDRKKRKRKEKSQKKKKTPQLSSPVLERSEKGYTRRIRFRENITCYEYSEYSLDHLFSRFEAGYLTP